MTAPVAPSPGLFYGWKIVAASFLCLMVGINPVVNLVFGVFLPPLSEEFGWSRSQAAHGVSLAMLGFTLMQTFTGRLIAQYGTKRIILGSAILFSAGLLSLATLVVGRWSFYACTFLWGAVAGGTSPLPHVTLIAHWFTRRRGLAMGIITTGVATGGMLLPPLVSVIITSYGWRAGFAVLGMMALCVTLPVAMWIITDTPEERGLLPDGMPPLVKGAARTQVPLTGYSAAEVKQSHTFWLLLLSLFVSIATLQGSAVHLVPLLSERGFALTQAASTVSFLAIGIMCGMLSSGYLVDRQAAKVVALGYLANAMLSFALLWYVQHPAATRAVAVLLGMSLGATVQLIAALVVWCFGLRAFSQIYAMTMIAFGLGSMTGPLLGGWLYEVTGSYRHVPLGYIVGVVCAAILLLFVQRYPMHKSTASEDD